MQAARAADSQHSGLRLADSQAADAAVDAYGLAATSTLGTASLPGAHHLLMACLLLRGSTMVQPCTGAHLSSMWSKDVMQV